ncbi:unnamed protein product, partial [Tenebrio molitor]
DYYDNDYDYKRGHGIEAEFYSSLIHDRKFLSSNDNSFESTIYIIFLHYAHFSRNTQVGVKSYRTLLTLLNFFYLHKLET